MTKTSHKHCVYLEEMLWIKELEVALKDNVVDMLV